MFCMYRKPLLVDNNFEFLISYLYVCSQYQNGMSQQYKRKIQTASHQKKKQISFTTQN